MAWPRPAKSRSRVICSGLAASLAVALTRTIQPLASSVFTLGGAWSASTLSARRSALATTSRQPSLISCAGKKKGGGGGGKKKGGGGGDGGGGGGNEGGDAGAAPEVDTEKLIKDFQTKMEKSVETLQDSFVGIRAGKATPALLQEIKVDAYDSTVPIQDVASVTATDVKTLTVTPFDGDVLENVEKALIKAGTGYGIRSDGKSVIVSLPELTTDKRKEYVKMAKDLTEKSRQAVRNVRQTAMKKVKGLSKSLSEDIVKSLEKEVESLTKKNVDACDSMFKKKESELNKV